jgi:hypothetical protein
LSSTNWKESRHLKKISLATNTDDVNRFVNMVMASGATPLQVQGHVAQSTTYLDSLADL